MRRKVRPWEEQIRALAYSTKTQNSLLRFHFADEDSSSSEEDRQPAKTAPKNDAKTRAARRARRKENAQLRSHRIMEMDPSALGALRQSIRNRREEDVRRNDCFQSYFRL